ncbi:MAG: M48 family metallopeptidase [Methylocystaceae bacterium]|nr:M48 family metallopeptidase [Methylocystaceae bacterium]
MRYPASFMDGQTARRHAAYLSFASKLLIIEDHQGEVLATWPSADIVPTDKVQPGQTIILSCQKKGMARLHVDADETKVWLNNIIPGLAKRTIYKKENRLAWTLSLGTVLCTVALYFLLPFAMQAGVHLVPISWERDMFKGAGLQLAHQLGAKKVCDYDKSSQILKEVTARLIGTNKAKEVQVYVVDHKMVNAFATPGQEVVLMRGLIDKAQSAEEVIGVLAHELGHVDHRHPMQAALRGASLTFLMTALSGGNVIDLAALMAETSYSRDHEREADLYALNALKREGISTKGLADFFEKLDEQNHALESVLQLVSTHPMSAERAEMISAQKGGGPALSEEDWLMLKNICSHQREI